MEIRSLEAALRRMGGDIDPAAQSIAAGQFSRSDVLQRAVDNLDCGLGVEDALSEACDAYGHDYDQLCSELIA